METWLIRGYLVFAVAVLVLGGVVWVRVDLLPDERRAGGLEVATSQVQGGPLTEATPGTAVPSTPVMRVTPPPPVFTGACVTTPLLATPPLQLSPSAFFAEWYGLPGGDLAVAPVLIAEVHPQLPVSDARWFAGVEWLMAWFGTDGPLELSAVQIDGEGRVAAEVRAGQLQDDRVQLFAMTFPESGCWQVTAHGQGVDSDLAATVIVEVAPKEERPDFATALAAQRARPYAVPASCTVDGWDALADRSKAVLAAWWKDLPLVAVGHQTSVLWAEEETALLLRPATRSSTLRVEAESLDDGAHWSADAGGTSVGQAVALGTFATPGCWQVSLFDGDNPLGEVTVAVFPAACRRTSDATPVSTACVQAGSAP